jgi:hypothetical protein
VKQDLTSLKVGDTVWIVGHDHYTRGKSPVPMHEGKVTKVARKYLTVVYKRSEKWDALAQFDKVTGCEKTDWQPKQLYIDIQAYAHEQACNKLWRAICDKFRNNYRPCPHDVSLEDMHTVAGLLKISI